MALKRWSGGARGARQISTIKLSGNPTVGDKYTVAVGYAAVIYTVDGPTTNEMIATELSRLMNSATSPLEFADAFWTANGNTILGTGAIAGIPFGIEVSAASQHGTISVETPTQATGPNHFDNPDNWLDGSLPQEGDTVLISGGNSIYYGIDARQSFAELIVPCDFAGQIGLEEKNARGYREYRPTYCPWSAKQITIGQGGTLSSSLVKLDINQAECMLHIKSTGDGRKSVEPPLQIRGTVSEITVDSGVVEIACRPYDLASFHKLYIQPEAIVRIGLDVIAGTITSKGSTTVDCNCKALNVLAGKCHFRGKSNDIDIVGGELVYHSSHEIYQLKVGPGIFCYAGMTHCNCEVMRLRTGGQVVDPSRSIQADTIILEGSLPMTTNA